MSTLPPVASRSPRAARVGASGGGGGALAAPHSYPETTRSPHPPAAGSPKGSGGAMRSRLPPLQPSEPPSGIPQAADPAASLSMSASTRRMFTLAAGFDVAPALREGLLSPVSSGTIGGSRSTATPKTGPRLSAITENVPLYRHDAPPRRSPTPVLGGRVTPSGDATPTPQPPRWSAAEAATTARLRNLPTSPMYTAQRLPPVPEAGADVAEAVGVDSDTDSDGGGDFTGRLLANPRLARQVAAARAACGTERHAGGVGQRNERRRMLVLASAM